MKIMHIENNYKAEQYAVVAIMICDVVPDCAFVQFTIPTSNN